MDIAVNLIENYLRISGYLTLSEFEIQKRDADGSYHAVTDIDVMGVRFPGSNYIGDPHDELTAEAVVIEDPVLQLLPDCVDVIIGEVKQGVAVFNPGMRDHAVLHSSLRRVEWLYGEPLSVVIGSLQKDLVHISRAREGGTIRTRLVAFGRSEIDDLNTISLSHVISHLLAVFEDHQEAFRPIQFREPAPAFLRLLLKAGFDVTK